MQMVTGQPPHQHLNPAQILMGIMSGTVSLAFPHWCPPGLTALGRACLAQDQIDRPGFDSIMEALDELAVLAAQQLAAGQVSLAQ